MDFPEWAPKSLVELHKRLMDSSRTESAHMAFDPESIIADILQKSDAPMSQDNVENMRKQLYRKMSSFGLPEKEEIALLEKLITDQNMKTAWMTLLKRYKDQEQGPLNFFHFCQRGVVGWRGDSKQTPAERKVFYQELYDTVVKLDSLMNKASGFDHYPLIQLMGDDTIEAMIDTLEISAHFSEGSEDPVPYVRFWLSDFLPSIETVLSDIGKRAIALRDEPALMKKPNSRNAGVHYFIRCLSHYCQSTYGQPLHEVVAITTSVIFELSNCDESYVRKIAKA